MGLNLAQSECAYNVMGQDKLLASQKSRKVGEKNKRKEKRNK